MYQRIQFFLLVYEPRSSRIQRTNNAFESFHIKFNSYFEPPRLNILIFIEVVKLIQIETERF